MRHLERKCGCTELAYIPEYYRGRQGDSIRNQGDEKNAPGHNAVELSMFHGLLVFIPVKYDYPKPAKSIMKCPELQQPFQTRKEAQISSQTM
jgi:hypothetical protein